MWEKRKYNKAKETGVFTDGQSKLLSVHAHAGEIRCLPAYAKVDLQISMAQEPHTLCTCISWG